MYNQFTNEYWDGPDKRKSPNYVFRELLKSFYAPFIYGGHLEGTKNPTQEQFKSFIQRMLNET